MSKEEFALEFEEVKVANLSQEQLKEVHALEQKLDVVLIAYENSGVNEQF